ncbi:hypothetical protein KSP39_PZI013221 [Platanthera zijinensis]|uniref:Complex I assembly factor TIMMDC1, mitochondrial n=1 Tax=Platanthera zijinensis TaxID=2320716 RepID=A0AAP0G474_9ASPA
MPTARRRPDTAAAGHGRGRPRPPPATAAAGRPAMVVAGRGRPWPWPAGGEPPAAVPSAEGVSAGANAVASRKKKNGTQRRASASAPPALRKSRSISNHASPPPVPAYHFQPPIPAVVAAPNEPLLSTIQPSMRSISPHILRTTTRLHPSQIPTRVLPTTQPISSARFWPWGKAEHVGIFAKSLYGGSKKAAASISKDAGIVLKLGSTPDKREQYRLMRDAMGKRFIQVTRGSVVGGVRLGMFTSTFYGLNHLLADIREVHDVFSVTGAGSAIAAIFGLILPGSVKWRARNVLLGSALGARICFPLEVLQLSLHERGLQEYVYNIGGIKARGTTLRGIGAIIEQFKENGNATSSKGI